MPVLSIHLEPGESVVAEAGEFSWMTDAIQMSTGIGDDLVDRSLLQHVVAGPSPLMSTYTAQGGPGTISFALKVPGSILPVDVRPGAEYMVHRRGFLAGTPGVEVSAGFQRSFRAGIFAGEGFSLQRLGGQGRAWVELSGQVVAHELAACQVVRVPGIANRYFGGDAHYFAELSGPGTVWLQSMPLPQLAASLIPYLPAAQDRPEPAEPGLGGHPVAGDRPLRRPERDPPVAHRTVQRVLDRVLRVGPRAQLRPEVGDVVAPAQLERDQVVQLADRAAADVVGGVGDVVLGVGGLRLRRADRLGVAGTADGRADVRLPYRRVHAAGCAGGIGELAVRTGAAAGQVDRVGDPALVRDPGQPVVPAAGGRRRGRRGVLAGGRRRGGRRSGRGDRYLAAGDGGYDGHRGEQRSGQEARTHGRTNPPRS